MIKDSPEHEAYKQQVLQEHEAKAVAKFKALIPTFTKDLDAALDALGDLVAVRGWSPSLKRIMWGLVQLDTYRRLTKPITV